MNRTAVSEYGFINSKLRARISTILTEDFQRNLMAAEDIAAAVQVLEAAGFQAAAEQWNKTGDLQSLEFELFKQHIDNYRTVLKCTTNNLQDFVKVLLIRPEIENIKSVMRLWYGSRIRKRPIGYRAAYIYRERIFEKIDWDYLINAVEYEDIVNVFKNTVYREVFESNSVTGLNDGLFRIEVALDRMYYRFITEKSAQLRNKDGIILKQIISTEIDLQNISWIIRYRHFYNLDFNRISEIIIPGGSGLQLETLMKGVDEPGSGFSPADLVKKSYPELSALNISDRHNFADQALLFEQLLDETRKRKFSGILSGYPFTIGIILVYFFMSEREMSFISTVINGKNYKFSTDRIGELTR